MDGLRKQVSQLNPGTNLLEEILGGVPSGRPKFVGYNYDVLNQHQQNIETKFIPAEEVLDPYTGKMMLQHPKIYPMVKIGQGSKTFSKHPRTPGHHGRSRKWICHHCGIRDTSDPSATSCMDTLIISKSLKLVMELELARRSGNLKVKMWG
ncbi:hypothetical protein P8452_57047 [Trifolium repens]|nr:hypothetical protein P8452_57047 [Trifolium repens]